MTPIKIDLMLIEAHLNVIEVKLEQKAREARELKLQLEFEQNRNEKLTAELNFQPHLSEWAWISYKKKVDQYYALAAIDSVMHERREYAIEFEADLAIMPGEFHDNGQPRHRVEAQAFFIYPSGHKEDLLVYYELIPEAVEMEIAGEFPENWHENYRYYDDKVYSVIVKKNLEEI